MRFMDFGHTVSTTCEFHRTCGPLPPASHLQLYAHGLAGVVLCCCLIALALVFGNWHTLDDDDGD